MTTANKGFSNLKNTVVTSGKVIDALALANMVPLKSVTGYVIPTTIGTYYVRAYPSGNLVTIPDNALVHAIFLRGNPDLGGDDEQTVLKVVLNTADGSNSFQLCEDVNVSNLQDGVSPVITGRTGVTSNYVTIVTTGGNFTNANITVTLLYFTIP